MARHGVNISPDVLEEIQRLYLAKKKTTHGAIQETLIRGLELAVEELRGVPRVLPSTGAIRVVDTIHKDSLSDNLHESEREFLLECLRIYRSEFRRPLQENVTFFGIGLSAVEQIAAMGMNDERSIPNADALSPGEQRAFALADHAENEVDLLKAATRDVVEKLRRPGIGDPAVVDGAKPRRKSGAGKAGGRSGD